MTAADAVSPPMAALSAYVAGALGRRLPEEVAAKTKLHLLDTLAAMLSGARLRPGRLAIAFARGQGGRREAAVAGTRLRTAAINAALANGILAHADETDDSHLAGLFHPGCAVVPAALAVAERQRQSGAALLNAVALGYDVGVRVNLARGLKERPPRSGHSTHSVGTVFGAAAAAAALLGLDARRARHALSYAAQQASGLTSWSRDEEHVEKAFDFGGMPARNGVTAALIVAAGGSGVDDVLSGPGNFFTAFADAPRPDALADGLGRRYEILDATIKKWCVGSPIQAALDALQALMGRHRLAAGDVAELTVELPDDRAHIVDDRAMPDICVQHLLAVMLLDGTVGFAAAHDYGRMRDRRVRELRARMRLLPNPELTRALPPRQAIVAVRTRDGRELRQRTRAVRGTPANPMHADEVEAKALDLIRPAIGAARAGRLIQAVRGLERVKDCRALGDLVQPKGGRRP
jgi:2-methylcitrate dehydratase PrpD